MGQYTDRESLVHAGQTVAECLDALAKRAEPWLKLEGDEAHQRIVRTEAAIYSLLQGASPAATAMVHALELDKAHPEKWSIDAKVFYVMARAMGVALAGTDLPTGTAFQTLQDLARQMFEGYAEAIRDQAEHAPPIQ